MDKAEQAIELPIRHSRNFDGPDLDIYDPNYIPLLNRDISLKVAFTTPAFSGLPSLPTPNKHGVPILLKRSNSATAPEILPSIRDVQNLPNRRPAGSKQTTPCEIGTSQTIAKEQSQQDSPSLSISEPSVACTVSSLEEQVYTIPGNVAPKIDELQYPTLPLSVRSSMSSTTRTVPTSRYNKHSLTTIPNYASNAHLRRSPTPLASQDESLESTPLRRHGTARSTPLPLPRPPPPPDNASPDQSTSTLLSMKSSASERRARALHSHPSNLSIKSKVNSTVESVENILPIPDPEPRMPMKRARSQSIVNSTQPSLAPDMPLPDLPPQAKHSPATEKTTERRPERACTPSTVSSIPATLVQNDHTELAEFMTSKKSTLFRRFDDVHVRLLLHLQDEIAILEKQLLALESEDSGTHDNSVAKAKVMRELRKAIGEYDNLFATWNSMQANKASDTMKEQLTEWLQHSGNSGSISQGAKQDLSWLQSSKDLSSVSIDPEKGSSETLLAGTNARAGSHASSGGGIFAWLGCVSRRK